MAMHQNLNSLMTALLLAGCAAQTPPVSTALPDLPAQWRQQAPAAAAEVSPDWWRAFGSEELNALVQEAQAQNLDVVAAAARVSQAQASARMTGAALLPAIAASTGVSREGRLGGSASVDGTALGAGLSASYEVDLWGRLASGRDAAFAAVQASRYDRETIRLTVTAGVASAWLQAVALQERLDLGARNLASSERLLALVSSRARAGAATQLEVAQQSTLVATQRRQVVALKQQADDAQTVIAVLLGRAAPVGIEQVSLATLAQPSVAVGLPSALLTRRPDIARAEARLAVADADVAVARAAMLPSLVLTGSVATSGDRLRRVLDNPVYSLAAALAAPIFDGGRLAAGRDLAQARRKELLAGYRAAIVAAFADVEVALNAGARLDEQSTAQADVLAQAQRALALAESRYRTGAETLLVLIDAQRTVIAAQDVSVQLRLARLQAAVSLVRAVGGGWQAAVPLLHTVAK